MSDRDKPDLGDLDWDAALDEWEKNTFVPEVASDAGPSRAASPSAPDATGAAAPPRPAAGVRAGQGSLTSVSGTGTVIAPVPSELRVDAAVPLPPASPFSARPEPRREDVPSLHPGAARSSAPPAGARPSGGLGQLFSRSSHVPPPPPPPRPGLGRAFPQSEPTRVAPAAQVEELAVSSAWPDPITGETRPSPLGDTGSELDVEPDEAATRVAFIPPGLSATGGASPARADAPHATTATENLRSTRTGEEDEEPEPTLVRESASSLAHASATAAAEDGSAMLSRQRADSLSDAETATRLPTEDDDTVARRSRPSGNVAPSVPRARLSVPADRAVFDGERPVSRWLDEAQAEAFRVRAAWLEEEARSLDDPTDMARALLTVSELRALIGDDERALALAYEARELAPHVPLTWRQARQLAPRDADVVVEALDAEAQTSPTPAARVHATLLAADLLRTSGMGDAAVDLWDSACKLDPADVRAHVSRAALALAQESHSSKAFDLADNSELVPLHRAFATALRLRGHERTDAEPLPFPTNDGLRHARAALSAQDGVGAAQAITSIASDPALATAALWLASALSAPHIAGRRASARALRALSSEGDELARRQLAARGIELADPELVAAALSEETGFEAAERAALVVLAGLDTSGALADIEGRPELASLADAIAAVTPAEGEERARKRAHTTSGRPATRALATLGRLLATAPEGGALDAALGDVGEARSPSAAGVALELAVRERRFAELSLSLSALPAPGDAPAHGHLAAAIVAARGGEGEHAARAWSEALSEGARHDTVARAAVAAGADLDLSGELVRMADELPDGVAAAVLRLEALARTDESKEDARLALLDRIHRSAPKLGIGAFLAERIARRRGDLDEVLRWIHERGAYANEDPLEAALDAVREALLVADRDPERASARLEEAHRARPDDVALRELHERLATEPPRDRAEWRVARAEKTTGAARALLFTEAALEHERNGDLAAALAAARRAAEAGDTGLSRLIAERAELELGDTPRIVDELGALAADVDAAPRQRREARLRLADLAASGRKDEDAALAWHRAILEEEPGHKPSLRWVEHVLVSRSRDDELRTVAEQIALALDGTAGGEVAAHAQLAARLCARAEGWERTGDMARLAAAQPDPSLWSLRARNAHARLGKDDDAELSTTLTLLERTARPSERAALLLRASQASARAQHVDEARKYLEQAATEDPGDVVTWGLLAEVRQGSGDHHAAAEACESLARASAVPEHQLLAWYDAARIWLDEVKDAERGMSALEQAAELDVRFSDVFTRLSSLYAERRLDAELARLLEKRLDSVDDVNERVALQVELSRALADMGELRRASATLQEALDLQPDHTTALSALAELCEKEGDWPAAEQAYVRLARLAPDPSEQRAIYERLGEIYSAHAPNLSRAEVALREVLKRAPNDAKTLEKLVDVYKRQGDIPRAIEAQQQLVAASPDSAERLRRQIELAGIYETAGRDLRKAEHTLETARKEFPTSVVALRALAEFYGRQRQMPAMHILLDRAAGDARRSFAAGRFVPSLFEIMHAAYELRGKRDAARVVAATLAAVEAQPAQLTGAEAHAVDPQLDDVLAPETMSPALRLLLAHAGDALDAVAPLDLRALEARPLPPRTPLATAVGAFATMMGLGMLQVYVSPKLGRLAVPLASNPPALLVGDALADVDNERARAFVIVRALKMILVRGSALLREKPEDAAVLVNALFTAFNPTYAPQGVDARKVAEVARRVQQVLPRNLDPTVGVIALEAAGMLGAQSASAAAAGAAWANRVGLLAVGDPNAALDGIAWARREKSAPSGSEERGSWIARTAEARELMTFSVTDAYAEARARLKLG